ncbi:MAG: ABC transporter substrate-binding protein [Candidatus Diapherotrites archaeon]
MDRTKFTAAIIVLVIILAGALFLFQPRSERITLSINPFPLSALIFIAEEKGYFAEEGLEIEYANFQTGKAALDASLAGGSELATTADIPIMLAGLNDLEFKVIATIASSEKNIRVVARKDSGISEPSDLRGKKIATTSGGGPLFFTHKFLERHQIALDEVSLTHMNPSDMILAIVRGDIDAIIIFGPHHLKAEEELGNNAIVFSPDGLYGESWNLVVSNDFAEKNPEKVKAFLRALLKAERFAKENKEEAIRITAEYSNVEESIFDGYWELLNFDIVLRQSLLDTLSDEAEWAIEQGITDKKTIPDYSQLIDGSFLSELKPGSVAPEGV